VRASVAGEAPDRGALGTPEGCGPDWSNGRWPAITPHFGALVELDGDRSYAIAYRILRDVDRANDAVQTGVHLGLARAAASSGAGPL
jgi:hypothetical protein